MNRLACLLVLLVAAMLAGCSVSTIHPPSASAFMEKSEDAFLTNVSFSAYWGENLNKKNGLYVAEGVKEVERSERWKEDWYYVDMEWYIQFHGSLQKNIGHFKYGFGIDFATPYVQAGFVSDYLGVMGWSNLCLWQLEKVEHAYFQWGGGISLIEQLPIGDNFRIGLTQHLSRNARESIMAQHGGAWPRGFSRATPIFYDEIGGGAYVSFIPFGKTRVGIEFRYGRDLTYKFVESKSGDGDVVRDINRYSLIVSFISR